MAVTWSRVWCPDSKSSAAGKMLTPLEVRTGRFKCPSALEAGAHSKKKTNTTHHNPANNPKSSAGVMGEAAAPQHVLLCPARGCGVPRAGTHVVSVTLSALPCPWGWLQASSGAGEMSGVLLGWLYGTQVGGSPWDALLLPGAVGQGLRPRRSSLFAQPWPTLFDLRVSSAMWGERC